MALIKCPECGKEISSFAKCCIRCGFPLENDIIASKSNDTHEINICPYCGRMDYTVTEKGAKYGNCCDQCAASITSKAYIETVTKRCPGCYNKKSILVNDDNKVAAKCEKCGDIRTIYKKNPNTGIIINLRLPLKNDDITDTCKSTEPTVRCPKCSSTQITTGSRGYSIVTGFLGANKTVNRCAKCGYSWKPKG